MRYSCCFHVYRKEYLRKSSQNSVHYLSCHAVRCTADFNFCSSHMLKGLGLGIVALALKVQTLALRVEILALKVQTLALMVQTVP